METTCGSLLSELKKIWDEIGEPETERDRMIFELEQECMKLYRKKVDLASQCRAQLRQAVADSESELAFTCAAIGERPVPIRKNLGSLKLELQTVRSQLEEIRKKKRDRMNLFVDVLEQITCISKELYPESQSVALIDESDLSFKKLEDMKIQLYDLEMEKTKRLKQVVNHLKTLHSLCLALGLDFRLTVTEIHPTLGDSSGSRSISLDTIDKLSITIRRLKDLKMQRMQKLQDLAATMIELWCLMDTPAEEQRRFQNVTRNIAASEDELTEANTLSLDFIKYAEDEVSRLQEMKSSKIKEVLLKKKVQLEKLCKEAHMVVDARNSIDYAVETIESGGINPSDLLEQIELQISQVKEEAFSRKEILEKIEKWLTACEEESWLEEYSRDDNRYNAKRGTHMLLKRAEKARALVNKIPPMVEALTTKTKAWEKLRGTEFLYDGVHLLGMLDQYRILQQEKEQERQRERDLKKLQGQIMAEQEARFGSKPSPANSARKMSICPGGASNKRYSIGGMMLQNSLPDMGPPSSNTHSRGASYSKQQNLRTIPQNKSATFSSGKRDISGMKSKKPSCKASNPQPSESKPIRKPLSPLSSFSCTVNSANVHPESTDRHSINKAPQVSTPTKRVLGYDENETPKKLPIPMPTTPPTVSAAMNVAMTPATPYYIPPPGQLECSFEERRAGFQAF